MNQGLKKLPFEFAVLVDDGFFNYEYQLRSSSFMEQFEDTVNNFNWQYMLQPPPGSDLENLVPAQQMILIVPNFKAIVFKQMKWMIIGSVFFHACDHQCLLYNGSCVDQAEKTK